MWTPLVAAAVVRVLFIGNSLTTANDLPRLVQQLASAAGRPLAYRVVAFDGYSLEDHWNRGDARRAIAEGGWSYVILQQGPSALPESQALLIDYARRFADAGRRVGAEPALYMVWPPLSRSGDADRVRVSYENAARQARARLAPVGEAFRAAQRIDNRIRLFGADGFHPTVTASFLAALVMFHAIFRAPPPEITAPGISIDDQRTLRAALDAIVRQGAF